MSVRKNTPNRRTLHRDCGTCGKHFETTADTPWVRQVPRDGKKQAITYYCSSKCFQKSYKYPSCYDGKAEQRRAERYAKRDIQAKNRKHYIKHREEILERKRKYYAEHREEIRKSAAFSRRKRKLLDAAKEQSGRF